MIDLRVRNCYLQISFQLMTTQLMYLSNLQFLLTHCVLYVIDFLVQKDLTQLEWPQYLSYKKINKNYSSLQTKRATPEQVECLVSWMRERPSMASGLYDGKEGRLQNRQNCQSLADRLNAIRFGACKTGEKWEQVCTSYNKHY